LTAHPIRGNCPRPVPEATIKKLEASQTQTPVSDQSSTVPLMIARQWHEWPGCNKHGGGGGGGGGFIRDGLSTHHQFESQNRKTRLTAAAAHGRATVFTQEQVCCLLTPNVMGGRRDAHH